MMFQLPLKMQPALTDCIINVTQRMCEFIHHAAKPKLSNNKSNNLIISYMITFPPALCCVIARYSTAL